MEKKEEIIEALSSFVIRVAKSPATPDEINVLPEVAKIVLDYGSSGSAVR